MNYRETLKFIRQNSINVMDADIANEADNMFEFEYNADEFETLCELISVCYCKSDYATIYEITRTINGIIVEAKDTHKAIEKLNEANVYEILEKIEDYM